MDESNTVVKKMNNSEALAHFVLDHLGITHIMVPHRITDGVLYMERGTHPSRLDLDVVRLFQSVLIHMYQCHSDDYSPGIYSFMGSGSASDGTTYLSYLLHEVDLVLSDIPKAQDADVYLGSYRQFKRACKVIGDKFQPDYCLLHGDLFIGNILVYQDQFRLIDFEFLRFGPLEVELAFLLCWDLIGHKELAEYSAYVIARDLDALVHSKSISYDSAFVIKECLIPMFVLLAWHNASVGIYSDSDSILEGCSAFWHIYKLSLSLQ